MPEVRFLSGLATLALTTSALTVCAAEPVASDIQQAQRLSQWLAGQASPWSTGLVSPGTLHWLSKQEQTSQSERRAALVADLKGTLPSLASVLRQMPVTGRVSLPSADARWLEVNPAADPLLQPGDRVLRFDPFQHVALLRHSGQVCVVRHHPDATVSAYLQACDAAQADRAWVVQADGVVAEQGLQPWTKGPTVSVAPGAWIWAPARQVNMPEAVSARVAQWLSTQGGAGTGWADGRPRLLPARADWATAPRPQPALGNHWGSTGYLQMPSARMDPVGWGSLSLTRAHPYTDLKVRLQPLEDLSIGFGYVSVSGKRYGSVELAGDQSYKDKTADVKVRLVRESAWWPEVAVGLRDVVGTGLFSSEYVVASKALGAVDVSLGLGFGLMGARGDLSNPLGSLSDRFKTRQGKATATGGTFDVRSFFTGPAAVFAGVQWALPGDNWWLKAEYDSIDYSRAPTGPEPIRQQVPLNFALVHRPLPWLDLTVGVDRGNKVHVGVSMSTQLDQLATPKLLDPQPLPVRSQAPVLAAAWPDTARRIEAQTGARLSNAQLQGERLTLVLDDLPAWFERPMIDRVASVVQQDQPAQVQQVDVQLRSEGVAVATARIDRPGWVQARTQWLPPSERKDPVSKVGVEPAASVADGVDGTVSAWTPPPAPAWRQNVGLDYLQNLGGPDGFLLFQLAADWNAQYRLRDDTWFSGTVRLRLLDNYDKFDYTAPSNLPRVRTNVREYLTSRRVTVPNLQLTHWGRAAQDHFYLGYAGLLESMFAGAGGEYLYRPVGSRWAWGFDLNEVRQRGFNQGLSLRSHQVTTGHVTAYWDTGWKDVNLTVMAGRYLAGDVGVTLDASRMFANGVSMGAYATKTNVSAQQFGEGSFDKGIYVSMPFDVILPVSSAGKATVTYAPLIRDGGARLSRAHRLFDLTRTRSPRALD